MKGTSLEVAPSLFLYLFPQIPLPQETAEGHIVLSGNAGTAVQGPFAVDSETGFLLVTAALDREEQAEYQLQVWQDWGEGDKNRTDHSMLFPQVTLESQQGHLLWGPQPVRVRVKDENDQVPHFSQEVYRVRLSQGTRAGEWPSRQVGTAMCTAESQPRDRATRGQASPIHPALSCPVLPSLNPMIEPRQLLATLGLI